MPRHLFIFGLGYSAQAVAALAKTAGFTVSGTCRTLEKCAFLEGQGIVAYPFTDAPAAALTSATHILSSVPTQEGRPDPVLQQYASFLPPDAWLGYLSTTGVYGDHGGAWVDEDTLVNPENARLRRRVEAECKWRDLGGHVFRLAGIYGSGRSAIDDVLGGTARRIGKPGQVFSRIHVADIAQVVLASLLKPQPGTVYNVCDDEPAASAEVVAYACELLGRPVPPLIPYERADLSPMAREFYSANRRVRNARIKHALGVSLRYPTYREGLDAIAGTVLA